MIIWKVAQDGRRMVWSGPIQEDREQQKPDGMEGRVTRPEVQYFSPLGLKRMNESCEVPSGRTGYFRGTLRRRGRTCRDTECAARVVVLLPLSCVILLC